MDDHSPPANCANSKKIGDDDKFRIGILQKEYDTLRQEIITRVSNRFTLISIGGGLGVLLGMQKREEWHDYLLLAWVAAALILWWWTGLLIFRCSVRVALLERRINALAKDDLLGWETYTGNLQKWAWWRGFYPDTLVHREPDDS